MAYKSLKSSIVRDSVYIQQEEQQVHLECTIASADTFATTSHKNEDTDLSVFFKAQRTAQMSSIPAVNKQNETSVHAEKRRQQGTDEVEVTKIISKSENSIKQVDAPDQTIRRKLMARLRAQRAREKKKAQALDFTFDDDATSSSSEQHEINWGDASCNNNSLKIQMKDESNSEVELPAATCSYEVPYNLDLDPLKMEPNEDGVNGQVLMDSSILVSDFVTMEMKRMRAANAIPSCEEGDDEEEQYFKKAFKAERLRIENALNHTDRQDESIPQIFKLKEEPTIDFVEFNSINEWNPLDCSRDGSPIEQDIINETFSMARSSKNTKAERQAERMRKHRARKKQLETPQEIFMRKENQRRRAERARLKKKALQAGVLIESDIDTKTEDERNENQNKGEHVTRPKRLTRFQAKQIEEATDSKKFKDQQLLENVEIKSKNFINFSVAPRRKQRFENDLNADHSCGSLDSHISSSENVERNRSRCAQRARERRAAETVEETEARRLRARIAKMKNRLSAQLGISEDQLLAERAQKAAEMRMLRQKKRASETPEQAVERKRKQVLQARKSRSRILAAETPEETAARRAAGREYRRKRLSKLKEKETHEEKAQRKEGERYFRKQNKNIKLMTNSEVANNSTGNESSLNSNNSKLITESSSIMLLATSTPSACQT